VGREGVNSREGGNGATGMASSLVRHFLAI
jgi:hypothetical protein